MSTTDLKIQQVEKQVYFGLLEILRLCYKSPLKKISFYWTLSREEI